MRLNILIRYEQCKECFHIQSDNKEKIDMKIKGDYLLDTIGGEKMAVPITVNDGGLAGLIRLNEVGAFLWEKLQGGTTEADLVKALTSEYDVKEEKATADVKKFLEKLRTKGLLEE